MIYVWFASATWFGDVWICVVVPPRWLGYMCGLSLQNGLDMFGFSLRNVLDKYVICLCNMV